MGNLYPSSPQIKDGKMARFGFCGLRPWISGGGGKEAGGGEEGGSMFHFILSKIIVWGTTKTE